MKSSASMASGVKLLLFHQLARAELLQLGALDGQDGLAHGAEDLIGQGQSQRSGAGQSGCRDVVMSHREYLSF